MSQRGKNNVIDVKLMSFSVKVEFIEICSCHKKVFPLQGLCVFYIGCQHPCTREFIVGP
jgi:hypothetical protein